MTRQLLRVLAGLFWFLVSWPAMGEVRTTTWRDSDGEWADAAHWSAGHPDGLARGELAGRSRVRLTQGLAVTGGLQVGAGRDDVWLEVTGGQWNEIPPHDRIGEEDGGAGEIVQEAGALAVATIHSEPLPVVSPTRSQGSRHNPPTRSSESVAATSATPNPYRLVGPK